MSIPINLADSGLQQGRVLSDPEVVVRSQRIPRLVKVVAWLYLCLMLLILGVLSVASMGTVPELYEPPQAYLPGNSLPIDSKYTEDAYNYYYEYPYVTCRLTLFGQEVLVSYKSTSRKIVSTSVKVGEHSIGEFVLAWGMPKGFHQRGDSMLIYWESRTALLYTASLRPDSTVAFILYDLEQPQALPWHGFVNSDTVEMPQ